MQSTNIPQVKLGIIAVSRDCFPIALSTQRRENIVKAYKGEIYDCPTTVENEQDMLKAIKEVREAGCNALVVFLGNFGPETPETLIAKKFHGPCMFVSAAEGDGDMINGRGDAYCGMLNCSYNLAMRHLKGYIPAYPVGTADDIAKMIADFVPVARAVIISPSFKVKEISFKIGRLLNSLHKFFTSNSSLSTHLYNFVPKNCIFSFVLQFNLILLQPLQNQKYHS